MFEKNASKDFKRHAIGIIVLGCIAMYFTCCLTTDAMNVLQPAFTEKFGWSYSQLSMPFTVGGYILVVLSFFYSTIIIKNGTRIFGTVAFALMALGTFMIGIAYSMGESAYWVYIIGAMISKLAVQAVQVAVFQVCAEWFDSTRGRILGIVAMAAPLNSATSVTLMTIGKNIFGFNITYIIIAVILAVSTILAFCFGITAPHEMGMYPDGVKRDEAAETKVQKDKEPQLTMKDILTKSATWKVTIAFGILNGTIGAIMAFFITRMTEVNVPTATALVLLSVASLLGIPISYIFGWLDDKLGTLKCSVVLGVTYILLMICLYFGSVDNMIFIFGAVVGMACMTGGTPHLHPATIMHVFGVREYQNANRYIAIGIALISSYGVQLMSNVMDATGSLNMGYVIFGVLAVIATVCLLLTKKVETAE